jgi:hypothetical protein
MKIIKTNLRQPFECAGSFAVIVLVSCCVLFASNTSIANDDRMALDDYVVPFTTLQYDPKGIGPTLSISGVQPITYPYPASPTEYEAIPESLFYIDLPRIEASIPQRFEFKIYNYSLDDAADIPDTLRHNLTEFYYGANRPKYKLHLPDGSSVA